MYHPIRLSSQGGSIYRSYLQTLIASRTDNHDSRLRSNAEQDPAAHCCFIVIVIRPLIPNGPCIVIESTILWTHVKRYLSFHVQLRFRRFVTNACSFEWLLHKCFYLCATFTLEILVISFPSKFDDSRALGYLLYCVQTLVVFDTLFL